jgi:hypothetical protein
MYEKKNADIISLGRPDEKMPLGICGRIILKCNLERWNWRA